MSARFVAQPSRSLVKSVDVIDRKSGDTVAYCNSQRWAKMIADGLNLIVDQVTPWSPSAAHVDVLDGQVIEDNSEQKAIGWHDSAATHLRRLQGSGAGRTVVRHHRDAGHARSAPVLALRPPGLALPARSHPSSRPDDTGGQLGRTGR